MRAPTSGTMSSPCAATQAMATGATDVSRSSATFCRASTRARFARRFSPWSAGSSFDTRIDVRGLGGERTIDIGDFYREPGDTPQIETALARDEIILRVRVPASPAGRASTYRKIRDRESYAFALASAAVALSFDGSRVADARAALGGTTRPWRSREAEEALVGGPLTRERAHAAGVAAFAGAQPLRHNRYKVDLGVETVADALMVAKERA